MTEHNVRMIEQQVIPYAPLKKGIKKQLLNFLSRPRRFPKKFQAGLNARIIKETIDSNSVAHFFPSI